MRPLRSSSWKCSQVAQCGTRFEFAISTRGASTCVRKTPTGLPDCTSSVSSSFRRRSTERIVSKASQLRAALPMPPYTTSLSGCSATSGSRLFCSIRNGASVNQLPQFRDLPRGARTTRGTGGLSGRVRRSWFARITRIGHHMRRRDGFPMTQSRSLSAATLGALGVVYGDIGTSPLYALREATAAAGGPTPAARARRRCR